MNELNNITVTTKQLAEIFEVSESYISDLVNDHKMPKLGFNKFPLVDCIKFRFNHLNKIYEDKIIKSRDVSNRGRLDSAMAEIKELELAKLKGELAPVKEFEIALRNEAQLFIKGLDALVVRLPYELENVKDKSEMQKIIKKETDSIRLTISNVPADMRAEYVEF